MAEAAVRRRSDRAPTHTKPYVIAARRAGGRALLAYTAAGTQIYTRRLRAGGSEWGCFWPEAPTADREPQAIAVNGVNAYIAGYESYSGFDEVVLGHVY